MSEELKVTVFEPSKDPRSVTQDIDPEFVPLVDRGVYFNADGTLCDDYQQLPEDLSADEMIGFHTQTPSTSNAVKPTDAVKPIDDAKPTEYVKPTDAVYPIIQRQKKLQKKIMHLEKIKPKINLKNKLKKLRKKLKWAKDNEATLRADPESCIDSIPEASSSQPNNPKQPVNSKPNANPNRKFRQKKKKAKSPANAGPSQLPNPSRLPAFIRDPWMRKNPPYGAPRMSNPPGRAPRMGDILAQASLDYIPIGRNNHPRFRYNGHVPPHTNTNRYFNLNNC